MSTSIYYYLRPFAIMKFWQNIYVLHHKKNSVVNKKLVLVTYYGRKKKTRRECFLENEQKNSRIILLCSAYIYRKPWQQWSYYLTIGCSGSGGLILLYCYMYYLEDRAQQIFFGFLILLLLCTHWIIWYSITDLNCIYHCQTRIKKLYGRYQP